MATVAAQYLGLCFSAFALCRTSRWPTRRVWKLPFGVQPDHPRVNPIVDRIRNESGELVGRETYAETLDEIRKLEPIVEQSLGDLI